MDVCVDSACGSGSLLRASERAFPRVRCVGIDRDRRAIERLAQEKPKWVLASGDLFFQETWSNQAVRASGVGCDYVLINPPFSMRSAKGTWGAWGETLLRCSVSMAHLMITLSVFRPRHGGAAIVPESLVYSELDERARQALAPDYTFRIVKRLHNSTFKGTRANAIVLRILTQGSGRSQLGGIRTKKRPEVPKAVSMVRGGVPLFEAVQSSTGIPLIHSTDIGALVHGTSKVHTPRVRPIGRGQVRGYAVLLPRVGVPARASVEPVFLGETVQLSDCVIALCCESKADAARLTAELQSRWTRFLGLYRGTGARYTTVRRLAAWLGLKTAPR
jgi:predicted RNA methylase